MTVRETSLFTYHNEVVPTLSNRHEAVLAAMRSRPDWSNTELAAYLGWPINRVTPRVHELRHLEPPKIREAGKRQCLETGRTVLTWALTDEGRKE